MALRDKERYYWLKLDRGFFKRHDIAVIEDMPNGKDYVLFYLKLMLESVDHEGALRFSDTIPYNEQMLASVTKTNIDIVRSAMRMFEELGMVEVFDDKTLFMTEVAKLLGSETYAARRKREQRSLDDAGDIVPRLSPECPQEKEIEKDKEIDTEKDIDDSVKKEINKERKIVEKQRYGKYVELSYTDYASLLREFGNAEFIRRKNAVDLPENEGKDFAELILRYEG